VTYSKKKKKKGLLSDLSKLGMG